MTLYAKINSVVRIKFSREVKGRRVGMADEADSKSVARNGVWVQVPPPAPSRTRVYSRRRENQKP